MIKLPDNQAKRYGELLKLIQLAEKYKINLGLVFNDFDINFDSYVDTLHCFQPISDETYIKAHLLVKGFKKYWGDR